MRRFDSVIVLSNEPWGEVWFSKQHYAHQLAKKGYCTYFINPTGKWGMKNLFLWGLKSRAVEENLVVIDYQNVLPGSGLIGRRINDFLLMWRLRKLLDNENLLIWNFDPFRLSRSFFFKNCQYVYHVVDRYLFQSDLECAEIASIIPIVTKEYIKRYDEWNEKLIHIPHGLPASEFEVDENSVREIRDRYDEYLLFVGTLHDGLDFELLDKIASRFPNLSLVIVGPESVSHGLLNTLREAKNVYFTGPIPSNKIKNYIAGSRMCLIPYKMEQAYRAQTLKSLHYLAQHKPIISIPLKDWENFEGKYFFFGSTHEKFLDQIRYVLGSKKPVNENELDQYLESVSYEFLIDKILDKLENQ